VVVVVIRPLETGFGQPYSAERPAAPQNLRLRAVVVAVIITFWI
jgi:hypothetical protein